jgi:hypothetical protein
MPPPSAVRFKELLAIVVFAPLDDSAAPPAPIVIVIGVPNTVV